MEIALPVAATNTGVDLRRLGLRTAGAGAAAQLGGLAVDVWRHTDDPTLASREALLTFENLGHVLLLAGIALVVVGMTLVVFAASRFRVWAPITMAVVLGASTVVAANTSLARGHDHDATAPAGDHHTPPPAAKPSVAPETPMQHDHGDGTVKVNQPLDPATRAALADQLRAARTTADRFPTVAEATAAGYRMVTRYLPLIGAHYMRFGSVDGRFDVNDPEMLLYDGTDPGSKIVGLSYYVRSGTEPEGFVGPNDHWHRHIGLCVNRDIVVVGGSKTTPEECARLGGTKVSGTDAWMVHAWVVPGWESPQGVFSDENTELR